MVSDETMSQRYGMVSHIHVHGSQISLQDRSDPNKVITLWSACRRSSHEVEMYARGVVFAYFGRVAR